MNCNTCRFELSQCLDGRLASGRRAIVMQHAATCEECASFWSELQQAQQLTLQLPKERVSEGFREQLWERIRAGEGTPEAVFHEPVPISTKVRYLLTGAAAAAAVLLFAMWMRDDRTRNENDHVASISNGPRNDVHKTSPPVMQDAALGVDPLPLFTSTQPLTAGLLAVEAAKGFEQRCLLANRGIAQIGPQAAATDEGMVRQVFRNAIEARDLGQTLLDLRDRDRLSFRDPEVFQDLLGAVNMLGEIRETVASVDTVRTIVAPALRSFRLGNITRAISLPAALDPSEEQDVLIHMNVQRPQVIRMLFLSFGPNDEICEQFGLHRKIGVFALDDQCGPSFVAPRRMVDAGMQRLRLWSASSGGNQQVQVQVQVEGK